MRHKFLLSSIAALWLPTLLLSGCSEETGPNGPNSSEEQGSAISFHSATYRPANSKAQIIDGNNINNFKVSANSPNPLVVGQTVTGVHGFNFFEDINVLRNNDNWDYSPNVYWPNKKDSIVFYAISPAASVNTISFTSEMADPGSKKNNAIVDYDVPNEPGPTVSGTEESGKKLPEDFLFAVTGRRENNNEPVLLNFRHALSMVIFSARNTSSDIYYTIEKVELTHLKTRAKLDLSQDFTNDSIYWTPATNDVSYVAGIPLQNDKTNAITIAPGGMNAKKISISGPTEGVPVMPQAVDLSTKVQPHAVEPNEVISTSGLLITYSAWTGKQLLSPKGTQYFFPLPSLYKKDNYGGEPNLSGDASLDAFAFQLGKRYEFEFDFDNSLHPRIEFSTGPIYDFNEVVVTPTTVTFTPAPTGTYSYQANAMVKAATVAVTSNSLPSNLPWRAALANPSCSWIHLLDNTGVTRALDGDTLRGDTQNNVLTFSLDENTTGADRTDSIIVIADQRQAYFYVTQKKFTLDLDSSSYTPQMPLPYTSSAAAIIGPVVTTDDPDGWYATTDADWISGLPTSASKQHSGRTVNFYVSQNKGKERYAQITVHSAAAEVSFQVQQGPAPLTLSDATAMVDGVAADNVVATGVYTGVGDGSWTATVGNAQSEQSWLHVHTVRKADGTGLSGDISTDGGISVKGVSSDTLCIDVDDLPASTPRTGTINISDGSGTVKQLNVTQQAILITLSDTINTFTGGIVVVPAGGYGNAQPAATVTTNYPKGWSATVATGAGWLHIAHPTSSVLAANGTKLTYKADSYSTSTPRNGSITITAGNKQMTINFTQVGAQLSASTTQFTCGAQAFSFGAAGTSTNIIQAAGPKISSNLSTNWEASVQSGKDWITLDQATGGDGDVVEFTASKNTTGSDRYGVIKVQIPGTGASLIINVTQYAYMRINDGFSIALADQGTADWNTYVNASSGSTVLSEPPVGSHTVGSLNYVEQPMNATAVAGSCPSINSTDGITGDWRLPTKDEWAQISAALKTAGSTAVTAFGLTGTSYFTATSYNDGAAGDATKAFVVTDITNGIFGSADKTATASGRCVRSN